MNCSNAFKAFLMNQLKQSYPVDNQHTQARCIGVMEAKFLPFSFLINVGKWTYTLSSRENL
jgi:hypothetical protein